MGLSQGEFAAKAGVHRNTQARYESGKREPDISYLCKIKDFGVDTGYLHFGVRTDPLSIYHLAVASFLPKVMERVGLSSRAVLGLLDLISMDESAIWGAGQYQGAIEQMDFLTDALFEDGDLLASVFDGVLLVEESLGIRLSYRKKAKVVAMLFRSSIAAGKVDPAMIEEAVKLASG